MDTASGASSGDYNAEQVEKWYIWENGEQLKKCMICWDNFSGNQMHEIRSCHHSYCYSCMSDHVEYMLRFHAGVPVCPNGMCKLPLTEDGSKKFLSAKMFDKFMRRLEEAKIPSLYTKCMICWDNFSGNQMHVIRSCHHSYCYSCMSDHVEYMLRFHAGVPVCPNEMCKLPLTEDDSKKFLSAKIFDKFMRRLEEAKIPDSQKLYCPYPNCSALMAAECLPEGSSSSSSSPHTKECRECPRLFCIECRVPWHTDVSCQEYTSQFCRPDVELHMLAEDNKWRSCPTCKHLIERSEGCDAITCRCGSVFCYHCRCLYRYLDGREDGIQICDCADLTIYL